MMKRLVCLRGQVEAARRVHAVVGRSAQGSKVSGVRDDHEAAGVPAVGCRRMGGWWAGGWGAHANTGSRGAPWLLCPQASAACTAPPPAPRAPGVGHGYRLARDCGRAGRQTVPAGLAAALRGRGPCPPCRWPRLPPARHAGQGSRRALGACPAHSLRSQAPRAMSKALSSASTAARSNCDRLDLRPMGWAGSASVSCWALLGGRQGLDSARAAPSHASGPVPAAPGSPQQLLLQQQQRRPRTASAGRS